MVDLTVHQREVTIEPGHITLPRAGKERAFLTIHSDPAFSVDVEVDVQLVGSSTWYTAAVTNHGNPLTAEVMLAGPDANMVGALPVVASGLFRVRFLDAGETVIRGGGYIALGQ